MRNMPWQRVIFEDQPGEVEIWQDGTVRQGAHVSCSPDFHEQFQAGRRCVRCLEPQEEAWPERCSLCDFPIREHQDAYYRRFFRGTHDPHDIDIEAELDRLDEQAEKQGWAERKGIWLPGMHVDELGI